MLYSRTDCTFFFLLTLHICQKDVESEEGSYKCFKAVPYAKHPCYLLQFDSYFSVRRLTYFNELLPKHMECLLYWDFGLFLDSISFYMHILCLLVRCPVLMPSITLDSACILVICLQYNLFEIILLAYTSAKCFHYAPDNEECRQ